MFLKINSCYRTSLLLSNISKITGLGSNVLTTTTATTSVPGTNRIVIEY